MKMTMTLIAAAAMLAACTSGGPDPKCSRWDTALKRWVPDTCTADGAAVTTSPRPEPRPETSKKGDASSNSGESRTDKPDNGKDNGRNRP